MFPKHISELITLCDNRDPNTRQQCVRTHLTLSEPVTVLPGSAHISAFLMTPVLWTLGFSSPVLPQVLMFYKPDPGRLPPNLRDDTAKYATYQKECSRFKVSLPYIFCRLVMHASICQLPISRIRRMNKWHKNINGESRKESITQSVTVGFSCRHVGLWL